ncbi:MAG: hypothetical protein GSR84_00290 [Desulfurococcales archaeon]|nr:hypothetical protein [Desulfurococcales archaeon]
MRRVVTVNSVPDSSLLDDPIIMLGPVYLTLRRIIILGIASLASAGIVKAMPWIIATLPGGVPFPAGGVPALFILSLAGALAFMDPGPLPLERQLQLYLEEPGSKSAPAAGELTRQGRRAPRLKVKITRGAIGVLGLLMLIASGILWYMQIEDPAYGPGALTLLASLFEAAGVYLALYYILEEASRVEDKA